MCYSAIVNAQTKKLQRQFPGARVDVAAFAKLYENRVTDFGIKIPKAVDANFTAATTADEARAAAAIAAYQARAAEEWEKALFEQKRRLADATRKLETKPTKAARESARVATDKIEQLGARLKHLHRRELRDSDSRIWPGHYAPIVMVDAGDLVIRPARYRCRPAGLPRDFDKKYPGCYNARRDSLDGFWKRQFGQTHAVVVLDGGFFENVKRHHYERRELAPGEKEDNLILHFNPSPPAPMTVACIYSTWTDAREDLLSFAIVTDLPPEEIAATGHDRCPVALLEQNVSTWLTPTGRTSAELHELLEQRERPRFAHSLAA